MSSTKPSGDSFLYIDIDAIDNKLNNASPKVIRTSDAPSRASRYTESGDTLFSMVRPYLRNIAKIDTDNCIASTGFYVCHTYREINKDYIFYLMVSDYVVDGLNTFMKGDNSPSINASHIDNWLFPIPPYAEQCRIVNEIENCLRLVSLIEANRLNLEASIKQVKSKILDLAIHGKLVSQDPTDEPASELLKRINPKTAITTDNAHSENLPEGWAACKLEDCFSSIRNGANIKQNKIKEGYPITRIETISNEFVDRTKMGYAGVVDENYESYYLKTNDILMSHINSAMHVGKSALCKILDGEKIIHGMNLLCLRPYKELDASYLNLIFKSSFFKESIKPYVKNAVNQASINIRNLGAITLYIPPIYEQHRIVAKVEELFAQLDRIESSLQA